MYRLCIAIIALSAALAGSAQAADKREIQARKDFAAGRYDAALDEFAELYAGSGDPVYLRNIARCYQKLHKPEQAIDKFREYLQKSKKISADERKEIDGYIEEMNQEAQRNAPAPAPVPEPTPPATPATTPAATPAPAPGAVETKPIDKGARIVTVPEPQRRRSLVGPILAGGVAVAAGVTGVFFGLAAKSAADSVSGEWDPSKASAGSRDEKIQWVCYGVAGAALITGVVLLMTGGNSAPEQPPAAPISLRSTILPGGAIAGAEVRF